MALIIPVFLIHEGCPHQCLFCNQQSITGEERSAIVEVQTVRRTVEKWLSWSMPQQVVQVAFYGGSFSCLAEERQGRLLAAVAPFLAAGRVDSIRISTRPDCISDSVCERLAGGGVMTVELGCQSMDDRVLEMNRRGHTVEQSVEAARLVRRHGMELGIQLMIGLPGETTRSFLAGIERVVRMGPACVRLYPALVIEQTELARMYKLGRYGALTLNRSVALTCRAYDMFCRAGIKVIRMGLQASSSLEKSVIAGPYHPAFGELVKARSWLKRIWKILADCPVGNHVEITISPRDRSLCIGPGRVNMKRLERLGLAGRLKLTTETRMERGTVRYAFCKSS